MVVNSVGRRRRNTCRSPHTFRSASVQVLWTNPCTRFGFLSRHPGLSTRRQNSQPDEPLAITRFPTLEPLVPDAAVPHPFIQSLRLNRELRNPIDRPLSLRDGLCLVPGAQNELWRIGRVRIDLFGSLVGSRTLTIPRRSSHSIPSLLHALRSPHPVPGVPPRLRLQTRYHSRQDLPRQSHYRSLRTPTPQHLPIPFPPRTVLPRTASHKRPRRLHQ